MAYIFMDESGDLGFDFRKPKTSKYFVISFLFARDRNRVERIVKKIFRSLSRKELRHHYGELHAYKETRKTRMKIIQLLMIEDVSIICIYLNKRKVYTKLQDEKHVLYNYVANILLDRIFTKKTIIFDATDLSRSFTKRNKQVS